MLIPEEGKLLVKLAREAVTTFLREGRKISPPSDAPKKLWERRGVFVSIYKLFVDPETGVRKKHLRGCVGYPEPVMPLIEATISAAIEAATDDPRFPQMTPQELNQVIFEVSVLTPLQLIKVSKPREYPKMIKIGVDGILVEHCYARGILLPQTAVEYYLTPEEFLSECCVKAGLPPDAWLYPETKVYKFQAEIFAELEPGGQIIQRRPDLGYIPPRRSRYNFLRGGW
ncbi:MAG: TIGR00296 family protein [Thermoprotei archaeon]|nr:MAG: TIGR00296 family protein [Thermoprotei archaeon]RLF25299.1 MAG: TIGR00296 family protein [Thermoprotei archaeon]